MVNGCAQVFFFFSSRRRHTRLQGDWSSDVCSSDLAGTGQRSKTDADSRRRIQSLAGHAEAAGQGYTARPAGALGGEFAASIAILGRSLGRCSRGKRINTHVHVLTRPAIEIFTLLSTE